MDKNKTFTYNCVEFEFVKAKEDSCNGCFFKDRNCVGPRVKGEIPQCYGGLELYIFKPVRGK